MGPNQLCIRATLNTMKWKIAMGAVCAIVLALPVSAQMRGGFATHGVPPSVTSFGFGGHPGFGGVPASVTSPGFGVTRGIGVRPGFRGFHGGKGVLHRPRGFVPAFNSPYFSGAIGSYYPVVVPYFDYFDYSNVQPPPEPGQQQPIVVVVPQQPAQAEASQQQPASPPEVIERQGDQYVRRQGQGEPAQAQAPAKPQTPLPPTIIVLRDGRKLELSDYAVTDSTLYDLSNGRAKKISLAQVDVPATIKVNEDRGIEFSLPAAAQ